jgi:uncharacterized phage-like protein YoqJ
MNRQAQKEKEMQEPNTTQPITGGILVIGGHRPHKLPGGYPAFDLGNPLSAEAKKFVEHFHRLFDYLQPDMVATGGALGIDQLATVTAIGRGIPTSLYLPKPGFEIGARWPDASVEIFRAMLDQVDEVYWTANADDDRKPGALLWHRNEVMVSKARSVHLIWDHSAGGTANTYEIAKRRKEKGIELHLSHRTPQEVMQGMAPTSPNQATAVVRRLAELIAETVVNERNGGAPTAEPSTA